MDAKKHQDKITAMGVKLANFRRRLAAAIGQKKIIQPVFGEMFGGYTSREINSYETGSVPLPGLLLFILWIEGNSLDSLFAEGPISDKGKEVARRLYSESALAKLQGLDKEAREQLTKEVHLHDKKSLIGKTQENPSKASGKRKASSRKARPTKKC